METKREKIFKERGVNNANNVIKSEQRVFKSAESSAGHG